MLLGFPCPPSTLISFEFENTRTKHIFCIHPHHSPGLYPEAPVEAGLVVDQVVGGVEDLIVATVPFLFAGEAEKSLVRAKLEGEVYPRFFGAFSRLLEQHGKGFFYGDQVSM